jgi:phage gp29-like protein
MKTQIDALHKFQNQLLSTFNAQDLTYFKRSGWSGLLENIDRLYATMLHDWDVLQKDTDSIEKAVRSLDWSLVPYVKKGEKVSDQAQKVAQVVEDALWRRSPQKLGTYAHSFLQLLGAIVHAEFRGQNVHRIVWQNDGKLIYPAAFVQLPPQFLRWEVEPGKPDLLLHVPDGEMADPVPFKPYQFIVALNNAGPDHPLYNATYYGLVAWFSAAKNGLGWFMQYAEQHHLPKPVFHYDNDEDREQLIKDLQQDRVVNAILLYGERQVEWANMPTGTTMPQKELLELAEAHCHKAILGQTLTSGTDKGSGSLAQAKVHAGVQADEVMKHAEFVADVINRQLIPAIVHLNFGKVEGMPLPELRFKLPQAAANIERAQFWSQVMQIPGMAVVKSEVYDSLGIAMPGDDDEVLEAPGGVEQGLAALLGGGGDDTPPKGGRKPKKEEVSEDSKDEVALAAKARPTDPLRRALPEWVKPIREKILQARRDGASFEELQRMLREARPDTRALAAAFAENVEAGLRGDAEEVEAAAGTDDDRRDTPIEMSDGTKCYTEDCERHKEENKTVSDDEVIEINFTFKQKEHWKKEFIAFYEKELAGKEIEVEKTGHVISFRDTGGAKRLAAKGVRNQKRYEAGKKLSDAVRKATLESEKTTEHKEKEGNKKAKIVEDNDLYYAFATPVKVNGKESTIRIYAMHRKDEENKKRLWFYEFSIN